ncbi:hypothetical protein F5Y17DRAFT_385581 [Xylariaceae sp. FL0594]|nr:hypothetical protein F5Y17DRAFT_385581 [Xylariaceae sp. FL0594]
MAVNGDKGDLDPICHIVTPIGMLGYGLDELATRASLASLVPTGVPTALILDSGSTDSGPSKLALGDMSCHRTAYVRDLSKLLMLVHDFGVPLVFSSAGGAGTDEHVDEMMAIIQEIASEKGNEHYDIRAIAIYSGIDKSTVLERLNAGEISGCGSCVPPLTEDDVTECRCVVAQMGPEPFLDAMRANPDFNVIVGGRAYDPSPYIAYAAHVSGASLDYDHDDEEQLLLRHRQVVGGFTHMGKIMECGGVCAVPKSQGAIATVYRNGTFDISPLDAKARCTPISVAAHTLYEKSRPDMLFGPGGYLDLNTADYEQLPDGRTVRAHGGTFHWTGETGAPYQVKLEAAKSVGFRTMYMGSIKDPILIRQLDSLLKRVKLYVAEQHKDAHGQWQLEFHIWGQTEHEPDNSAPVPEVFIIGEVLAPTQELSTSIAATARVATTHGSYAGQKATSGNFAFGIGGLMTIPCGPCAEFCIYHLMNIGEGEEGLRRETRDGDSKKPLFTSKKLAVGKKQTRSTKTSSQTTSDPASIKSKKEPSKAAKVDPNPETAHYLPRDVLGQVASVLRSKNAGPFEVTFDVMFGSEAEYGLIKESGVLTARTVARVLGVAEEEIVWCGFFDPARAFKVTIPRATIPTRVLQGGGSKRVIPSGSYMERDVHAAQQYLPLMYMKIPGDLLERLDAMREKWVAR